MSIKDLSENSKPRERALSLGIESLSDIELLAIIIGSGTKDASAIALASDVLNTASSLYNLSRIPLQSLSVKGIGRVKKLVLSAIFEICRRVQSEQNSEYAKYDNSQKIYEAIYPRFYGLMKERFMVILLDRKYDKVYEGFIDTGKNQKITLSFHELFKLCTTVSAPFAIIIHNHPSGINKPSSDDDETTEAIKVSLKIIDVKLLDHLIVTDSGYYSYKDNKKI
ncbi:MAG TPA: hypothetical protein DCY93_02690 [Firmicutes bacterium]|nr:hypothetical protein [Bacillota bacterium]